MTQEEYLAYLKAQPWTLRHLLGAIMLFGPWVYIIWWLVTTQPHAGC